MPIKIEYIQNDAKNLEEIAFLAKIFADLAGLTPVEKEAAIPTPSVIVENSLEDNVVSVTMADLDSDGVEWNADFHAASKTKNADGTWRSRRNVEKRVPAPPVVVPAIPLPPTPVVVEPTSYVNPFVALVTRASSMVKAGTISQDRLTEIVQSVGIKALPEAASNHTVIPAIQALLDKEGAE